MVRRKTALILALITGILLVTALPAVSQGPPRDGGGPGGGGPGDGGGPMCLAFVPGITAEQLEAIAAIRDEHHDATQDLRDKLYEAKTAFHELMRDPDPDLAAVRKAKEKLDALETDMLIARLEMRAAIRDVLTEEQRVFFDEMQACGPGGPGFGPGPGMEWHPGGGPGMGPGMSPGMGPGPGMSN